VGGRYFGYIVTNDRQTVLYTGVTDNRACRIGEHRAGFSSFTSRYNVWRDSSGELPVASP
jgi:predicted GIY-YIG superfamily endonuclease